MNKIIIQKLDKCFSVKIGCTPFFYVTKQAMLTDLDAYFQDPEAVTEAYFRFQDFHKVKVQEVPMSAPADWQEVAQRDTSQEVWQEAGVGATQPQGK